MRLTEPIVGAPSRPAGPGRDRPDRRVAIVGCAATNAPYCEWPDGALVAAAVEGGESAYAEIYRRHLTSVTAAATLILGSGAFCDDIVEDVFVEFWASPGSFDPNRGSLLTFLRLKARSRSIDALRSETSRRRREWSDSLVPRAPTPSIDARFLAQEAAVDVRRAVALLPATEAEVVRLAFLEGMTYRAVAIHLGLAEGTVKSRIRNGLRRLAIEIPRTAGEETIVNRGGRG